MKLLKNIKALSTSSLSWIQARSILVKRTSGGQKYYQKIQKETDGFGHEWNLTGRRTTDQAKKSKHWSNLME